MGKTFMQIKGMVGNVVESSYRGWIEVGAFNWHDFHSGKRQNTVGFVKEIDGIVTRLMSYRDGKSLGDVTFVFGNLEPKFKALWKVTLNDVLLAGLEIQGGANATYAYVKFSYQSSSYDVVSLSSLANGSDYAISLFRRMPVNSRA